MIYSLLSVSNGVRAFVGEKIFPIAVPQKTGMPAMVYALESGTPTQIKQADSPLDVETYTVTVFIENYANGRECMAAVRAALDQQSGTIAGVSVDSITFQGAADDPYSFEDEFFVISHSYQMRIKR